MTLHPYYPICGVDVSRWQTSINFDRLIEKGIQFMIAKSSQGSWQDKKYIQHTAGAIQADLPYGAYHYWSPAYTPAQNAAGMAKIVPAAPPFGCWLDVESAAGSLTVKQSTAHVWDTLKHLDDIYGELTGIYSNLASWQRLIDPKQTEAIIDGRPLWVANYLTGFAIQPRSMPAGWKFEDVLLWQFNAHIGPYAGKAAEFGIVGTKSIDINAFIGTADEFVEFCGEAAYPPPPEEPPTEPPTPPIIIDTPAEYKVMHDVDVWRKLMGNKKFKSWRSNKPVPEIYHFQKDTPVPLTEAWQRVIMAMNPGMTGKGFRSLFKDDRAVSNHGHGYGSEPKADFINGKDLDAPLPKIGKQYVMGGATLRGKLNGDTLTVETLDGSKPPPSAEWIMARPWLYYEAITVKPDGTLGKFPQRGGKPVYLPLVAIGEAKTKVNTPTWGKPYPYITRV